jgi:flagellar hook-basal body complex protein FliE
MTVSLPLLPAPAGVSPQAAARAYRQTDSGGATASGDDFATVLTHAVEGAVQTGQAAEAKAAQAIAGGADLTEVVEAVSRAQLTLQTATAIRDRVVQAYQDIMKMPI